MLVNLLLEGRLEEPVADKLLNFCGHDKGTVYGMRGCNYIRSKAAGFQATAMRGNALLVLTDFMDAQAACPPEALQSYFLSTCPSPSPYFLCRFAVNELESWLLADREALAGFLHISVTKVPPNPDNEPDPKQSLVNLARLSKKSSIRDSIAPPSGHKGAVSPLYLATMSGFVVNNWAVDAAMKHSPSLRRCVERLQQLES